MKRDLFTPKLIGWLPALVCLSLLILSLASCKSESPELRLQNTLDVLSSAASQGGKEPPLESIAKASELTKLLEKHRSSDLLIIWKEEDLDVPDKKLLLQKLTGFRKASASFEAKAEVKSVSKTGAPEIFSARVKVDALGSLKGGEGKYYESHLTELLFSIEDGEIQVEKVEHLDNLRE